MSRHRRTDPPTQDPQDETDGTPERADASASSASSPDAAAHAAAGGSGEGPQARPAGLEAEPRLPDAAEAPAASESKRSARKRRKRAQAGAESSSASTGARGQAASDDAPTGRRSAASSSSGGAPGDKSPASDDSGSAPPPRKGGRAVAVLALLLALAAGAAAGYLGWRLIELEQRVARIPEQRQAALESVATQDAVAAVERQLVQRTSALEGSIDEGVTALRERLARAQEERSEAIGRLRQRVDTAETAVQSLRDQRQRDGADWRMAEVRYLVSMGVRQLQITGNVAAAIAALEAADQALGQMGDPRVLELRQQIVDDIGRLREVEPADVEGIALRVQNLAPRIPELVHPAPAGADASAQARAGDPPPEDGGDGWWAALQERLSSLVTVRREPQPELPEPGGSGATSPAPSAELPPAERLLAALRDASRAALKHEPQAYQAALGRALEVVSSAYAQGEPANERFREALDALRQRRVTTELPDLSSTLERAQTLADRLQGDAGGDR